jgi:DNA polymerase-3 subunit epsilon|nr:exonuclease domain-containing protein [uncultured Psychroserpens sp.]
MIYTIIDVETTGKGNRMTEISIFKYDGNKVVDEFTTLINPESFIPRHITALTGIDNELVANAPVFADVAEDILRITEDTIFVAHNVNFDYNVIGGEFKTIGVDFKRKKLCTVRLSRQLLPGYRSYSLGKLCKDLKIELVDRHRARGDAEATVILFELLLKQPKSTEVFSDFMNKNSREATLPPNLPKETFEALPSTPGIYYFKDKKGTIIYIGKAKNIKKRVLSHFYSKTKKALDMVRETRDIDFELSGSELIALLMEDAAIKHNFPIYNKVSKRTIQSYSIFSYEDRNGVIHLAMNKGRLVPNPIITFFNVRDVRLYMETMCSKYNLCPKYCHLQESVWECSHYNITDCKGICRGEESSDNYNKRVLQAIAAISEDKKDVILKEKGRASNEEAFIWIKDNVYLGYGFIGHEEQVNHQDDLNNFLIPQKDNIDIQKILRTRLLKDNPLQVVI